MTDLTLTNARSDRDRLADRTDVLDRVGVLRTLPDDLHVTTPMVAEFYGVGVEAVKSLVKDNRDEVETDGYRVVIRSEFERSFGDPANLIDPRARQIALFPRHRSRSSAKNRADLLVRYGATAHIERSSPITWPESDIDEVLIDPVIEARALIAQAQKLLDGAS